MSIKIHEVKPLCSVSKLSTESVDSRRELVANSVHTADADATRQLSRVGLTIAILHDESDSEFQGPMAWNSLPDDLRECPTAEYTSSKLQLTTAADGFDHHLETEHSGLTS